MKTRRLRVFTRKFLIYTNLLVVIFYLLACIVPSLNPQTWWFISFLSLAFPFLLLLVFIFLLIWLILLKPKSALISALALLLSIKSISVFLAFHNPKEFDTTKDPAAIRVISWNVARFVELKRNNNSGSQKRIKMLELIKQQKADVLCLQEFHTSTDSTYYDNITAVQELGYPYYFFSFDEDGDRHYYSSVIFSKFPIIDTGRVRYPRPTLPDVLLHTDILFNKDTLRFYTTHLQSLQFSNSDYNKLGNIKKGNDSFVSNSKTIFSKIKKGTSYRSIQANIIREVLTNSPQPVIFCADLNDVPNSYTYSKVRGDMQDAFLKRGFGIGRTFSHISPTLRIDYIFADPRYHILQFKRIAKKLSDHYMLVADLKLTK